MKARITTLEQPKDKYLFKKVFKKPENCKPVNFISILGKILEWIIIKMMSGAGKRKQ